MVKFNDPDFNPFKHPGAVCPHGDEKQPDLNCRETKCTHIYLDEKAVREDQNGDLRLEQHYICDVRGYGFYLLGEHIDKPENYHSPRSRR